MLIQKGKEITKIDKNRLIQLISAWRKFYEFWEEQPGVLFIRYEDLQENTALHLNRILQAAGFVFNQIDIERAITKYPPQGNPLKHMDRYDSEAIDMIRTELADILMRFNYDL